MSAVEIRDDGFIEFKIGGVTKAIDAYAVWNRVLDTQQQCEDEGKEAEFLPKVHTLLTDLGFVGVSLYAADAFVLALNERVAALGKALGGDATPDSPASTAPPS